MYKTSCPIVREDCIELDTSLLPDLIIINVNDDFNDKGTRMLAMISLKFFLFICISEMIIKCNELL